MFRDKHARVELRVTPTVREIERRERNRARQRRLAKIPVLRRWYCKLTGQVR